MGKVQIKILQRREAELEPLHAGCVIGEEYTI